MNMAQKIVYCMLEAALKASKIAQKTRQNDKFLSILTQEKGLKNFQVDFKTLADVLIQQMIIKNVELEFPGMGSRVYGEEDNEFVNKRGEKIVLEIKNTESETKEMLLKILDEDLSAAEFLASLTHSRTKIILNKFVSDSQLSTLNAIDIKLDDVAFWVDPIDGTSHYVKGSFDEHLKHGMAVNGLQCVSVLIGAFNTVTGLPLFGVVVEPFSSKVYNKESSNSISENKLCCLHHHVCELFIFARFDYSTQCFWACSILGVPINNFANSVSTSSYEDITKNRSESIVVTSPKDENILEALSEENSLIVVTAGACAYKVTCVYKGIADLFVTSTDSCYKWDTCAVQALMMSIGGGICQFSTLCENFDASMNDNDLKSLADKYALRNTSPSGPANQTWANIGGIVAYSPTEKGISCLRKVICAFLRKFSSS